MLYYKHAKLILFVLISVLGMSAYVVSRAAVVNAPSISNLTSNSVTIQWTTNTPTDTCIYMAPQGQTLMGPSDGGDPGKCYQTSTVQHTQMHILNICCLSPGTTYEYKIGYENPTPSYYLGLFNFTTTGSGGGGSVPVAPSGLNATVVNGIDVQLTWVDNSTNESEFKIFRRPSGGTWEYVTMVGVNITTFTEYGFVNNFPAGTYEFYVVACSSGSCSGTSNTAFVTTSGSGGGGGGGGGDTTPPSLMAMWHSTVAANGATINWQTNEAALAQVIYGTTPGSYPNSTGWLGTTYATSGVIGLSGLTANTTYYYKVKVRDAAANEAFSLENSFITPSGTTSSDTTAPFITDVRAENIMGSGAQIKWTTDDLSSSWVGYGTSNGTYPYYVGDGVRCDAGGNVTTHCVNLTGLAANITYYYKVESTNTAGLSTSRQGYQFMTTGGTGTSTTTGTVNTNWVRHEWRFSDGAAESQILNRTDAEYLNFIASIDAQCGKITKAQWGMRWKPNAGNDQYWQEFGIPVCDGTNTSPLPSPSSSPLPNAVKTIKGRVTSSAGAAITDAEVGAWQKETGAGVMALTNANGEYVLLVGGGSWQIGIHPRSETASWAYSEPPQWVSFALDSASETRVVDFKVMTASSRVKGRVQNPDGSVPANVHAGADSGTGFGQGGPVMPDGLFTFALPAGSYYLRIFQENQGPIGDPLPFTLGENETKDFGTITITPKTDRIEGMVKDVAGHALSNIPVHAFVPSKQNFAQAVTQSDGRYTMYVTPGTWMVRAEPYPESNYANPEPPREIVVSAGISAKADFTLIFSDTTISGTVVDETGAQLTNFYGFVSAGDYTSSQHFGGSVDQGKFSFKVQAGTYPVRLHPAPGSDYAPPVPQTVTVLPGSSKTLTLQVSRALLLVSGQIKDEGGAALKNLKLRINASSDSGIWQDGTYDPAAGTYRIPVVAGSWFITVWVEDNSYALPDPLSLRTTVEEGKNAVKDIMLRKAGARITGIVRKPDGSPFSHAFVSADTPFGGAAQTGSASYPSGFGAEADAQGKYSIAIVAGTYAVRAFAPPSLGYANPPSVEVTVGASEIRNIDLQFRSPNAVIAGKIEGAAGRAFVYAWSKKGGYAHTETADDGSYTLQVTKDDTWYVSSSYEKDRVYFRSVETPVAVGAEGRVEQNLIVLPSGNLPDAVSRASDGAQANIVGVKDGASVSIPPGAIPASAGKVTITVTPDTRASSQSLNQVVGIAYNIDIRGADAKTITDFNTDVVVSVPYTDADVAAIGVDEEALKLVFWDESAGTWKGLPNVVVDTTRKVVTVAVGHLTRFALVAPQDTQPPDPPYNVTVEKTGSGFLVKWLNPTYDFHHSKIYRSSTKGVLGDVIFNNLTTTSKEDPTVAVAGVTFYYAVRVVDLAGNESTNTTQYTTAGPAQTPSAKELGPQAVPSTAPSPEASESAATPAPGIPAYQKYANGALLRAEGDTKIWIIMNGFKRYVVGPQILGFYGHLKNAPVLDVPQEELAQYGLAAWVRYVASPKVYEVNDDATKHWLDMSAEDFVATGRRWEAVFVINKQEVDFYTTGVNVTIIK